MDPSNGFPRLGVQACVDYKVTGSALISRFGVSAAIVVERMSEAC